MANSISVMGRCIAKIFHTTARGIDNDSNNTMSSLHLGTSLSDTAAPTNVRFSALQKFRQEEKCTNIFEGDLIYGSEGKNVTNDLVGLMLCEKLAVEFHDRLCQVMRDDHIVMGLLMTR